MSMNRVLQATPATQSATFYSDGVVVDPGNVTVTITREDGTALVTGQPSSGSGAAARTYNLTGAQTATLDLLRLDWVSASEGTITTYAEIVGGFLFGLSEARDLKPLDNTTLYPTAHLIAARTLAECALEDACGVPFVPRYARQKLDGNGAADILLRPRPLSVSGVTVSGTAATDLTVFELYSDGRVYCPTGWAVGRRNVVVKYTHGYPTPPPRVGRACLLLAKRFLVDSPISDRATTMVTPDGGTQFFVTAGVRDAVFDVPEANAVVIEYGVRASVG